MMEYQVSHHRYPYNSVESAFNYPAYCIPERNAPLAMSHYSRADARNYPVGGPGGGSSPPGRGFCGREDTTESGSARKRVSLACARCRKRKIRCSGDPGNGTGCANCKQAGVDPSQCQFHRVGSAEFPQVLASSLPQMVGGSPSFNPNAMMPIFDAVRSVLFSPGLSPNQYHQVDTKSMLPQWNVPYSEETSPVEAYGFDQTAYVPNSISIANVYGENHRWNQSRAHHGGSSSYAQPDAGVSSSYTTHGPPYTSMNTNLRNSTANVPPSPLNMTPLQEVLPIALPDRPHPRTLSSETPVQQRQLPMPLPSPAQTSRNTIDQLQDQRLRSAQALNGSLILNSSYASKPPMPWKIESTAASDVSSTTSSIDTSSTDAAAQTTTTGAVGGNDVTTSANGLGFLPVTTMEDSTGNTSLPQLNFGTTSLLEVMPPPTQSYSNFRDYNIPTSTATQSLGLLARRTSQTNLYSYTSGNNPARNSSGASSEATLVSGQRYSPLTQSQTQHTSDGISMPHVPIHRASMSNLNNRSF
ncbi:hypothetical protein BDV96DRAFT_653701 [Lophiotrema nucula]|uniref:Zn(2)-C6 fungal-type domain-containing protein n=1 Tax=Lophiotrema nucula TaxID=690887 RepID=A0A6A5YMS0_9PLEO|nr:hypothetical protein BDV96DRAFT_653701 [Lophiotrema nucula]